MVLSVFIVWIYNVDVVAITESYKDLQEHFELDWNSQKKRILFLSTKASCKGSFANQDY